MSVEAENDEAREAGFYWVRMRFCDWTIGEWHSDLETWEVVGWGGHFITEDIGEIGPRVLSEPPRS